MLNLAIRYIKENELAILLKSKLEEALVREINLSNDDKAIDKFGLIMNKPVLYVCNVDENSVPKDINYVDLIKDAVKKENAEVLLIGAKIEADDMELETYDEKLS